jgi:hypothetical protein
VVLGNGPSLARAKLPPDADIIGVNRSYEIIHAPIWCTVDYVAYETALRRFASCDFPPPENIYVRKTAVNRTSTPPIPSNVTVIETFRGNSGLFGVHVARCVLEYEQIFLLGFDSWALDNFYGPNRVNTHLGLRSARKAQRKALWKLREDARLYIWTAGKARRGTYKPLSEAIEWDKCGQSLS